MTKRGERDAARTTVGVVSLGCSKNLVDTEVMLGHLDRAGCRFVQDPAEAEVLLVNTCAFIEPAREESIQAILDAEQYRKNGKLQRLVVAGCMVQRYRDELKESLPEVDAFLDLDELDRIVECTEPSGHDSLRIAPAPPRKTPGPTAVAAWSAADYLYDDATPRRRATPDWSAYLKIAEGCDHTCGFCAIPSFRGTFRSRTPDSVLREATGMAADGVREINLIAQDSSHYGRDLQPRSSLADLLEQLDTVEELKWIRVHYLYPNTVDAKLIETMARLERVLDYVDIPLQHSHPETLARMRRGGSAESHLALLERFRTAMPDAALRSTLIVGFPGETDEEFDHLLDFVREARFENLGVFTYSHEERTPAHEREDDVDAELKSERLDRLMACQQEIAQAHNERRIGRRYEVLVEGPHPETEHLLVGRSWRQAPDVDGQVLINEGFARPGSFVQVELTETAGYDVVGRIVDRERAE